MTILTQKKDKMKNGKKALKGLTNEEKETKKQEKITQQNKIKEENKQKRVLETKQRKEQNIKINKEPKKETQQAKGPHAHADVRARIPYALVEGRQGLAGQGRNGRQAHAHIGTARRLSNPCAPMGRAQDRNAGHQMGRRRLRQEDSRLHGNQEWRDPPFSADPARGVGSC